MCYILHKKLIIIKQLGQKADTFIIFTRSFHYIF